MITENLNFVFLNALKSETWNLLQILNTGSGNITSWEKYNKKVEVQLDPALIEVELVVVGIIWVNFLFC